MAVIRLSAAELSGAPSAPVSEYAQFIAGLSACEGGRATVAAEGVSRQTIKARLTAVATDIGAEIEFHRTSKDEVIFEVVSAATSARPRRRRRRSASEAGV